MLQIQFAEIPEEGLALRIDEVSWFPDRELNRSGDLEVEVFLERNGETVLLRGNIEVALRQVCDRCLEEFVQPLKIDFNLVLELIITDEEREEEIEDHVGDRGGVEVIRLEQPVVDLADLLYQQLILSLPQKNLCRPDCLGLCEGCGANLNLESCSCEKPSDNSPFAVLGSLTKKNR